jgi:hypothetical protein
MDDFSMAARRGGKSLLAVEATKAAQRRGETVLWATHDQAATAAMLSKHGALSEVVGKHYLRPKFKEQSE